MLSSHIFLPFYLKTYFFSNQQFLISLEILPEYFTRLPSIYFILLKKYFCVSPNVSITDNISDCVPNCSVGVTVAVDKYVNSSIYFFGFYDFLWFMLDLYILGPLKCLMTSGSIKKASPIPCFCGSLF